MSRSRTVLKYGIASGVSALYGAAVYTVMTHKEVHPVRPKRVVAVAVSLAALTWIAALA